MISLKEFFIGLLSGNMTEGRKAAPTKRFSQRGAVNVFTGTKNKWSKKKKERERNWRKASADDKEDAKYVMKDWKPKPAKEWKKKK